MLSIEVEVGLSPFVVQGDWVCCFWLLTSGKINQSGLGNFISDNF